MKSDIEIANETKISLIKDVANKLKIKEDYLDYYGKYKAKLDFSLFEEIKNNKDGKLILVTSINPTPLGEGKTTMAIGLHDGICKLGYNSLAVLREPSLGPVFGIKGGATGGGYAQVVPMEEINLHFTGDIHAVTAANNLLCSLIDNHLYHGNELNIDPKSILIKRCLDINDRSLRYTKIGIKYFERDESFMITTATEMMAILCLASDIEDLKNRINNILIGFTVDQNPIYVRDLKCADAITILLKDAIKPNLVQTLENNPVLIHGGPFANIAHGCNSIVATKLGLKLSDYVVTEAGFGADLGAEKFLNIKCRVANLKPDVIVVNATVRSLKYNGLCPTEELKKPDLQYLKAGIDNLLVHIENMKKYTNNIIVCLNKFDTDSKEEINYIKDFCNNLNCDFCVCEAHSKGSKGSLDFAQKVIDMANQKSSFKFLYDVNDSLKNKIKTLTTEMYRANDVVFNDDVLNKISQIEAINLDKLPICIAKTQYSISDDPKKLGYPKDFNVTVKDIKVCSGAGFVVVYMGNIMTMPGLAKEPAALNMTISNDGTITGLF